MKVGMYVDNSPIQPSTVPDTRIVIMLIGNGESGWILGFLEFIEHGKAECEPYFK